MYLIDFKMMTAGGLKDFKKESYDISMFAYCSTLKQENADFCRLRKVIIDIRLP